MTYVYIYIHMDALKGKFEEAVTSVTHLRSAVRLAQHLTMAANRVMAAVFKGKFHR